MKIFTYHNGHYTHFGYGDYVATRKTSWGYESKTCANREECRNFIKKE